MIGVNKEMHYNSDIQMCGPYTADLIPQIKIDYRGLVKFAKSVGKTVADLSDSEKNRFIIGATMEDVKREMIKL